MIALKIAFVCVTGRVVVAKFFRIQNTLVSVSVTNDSIPCVNDPPHRQWRVEERDDWRALLDSMQSDRTALQQQNERLEVFFPQRRSDAAAGRTFLVGEGTPLLRVRKSSVVQRRVVEPVRVPLHGGRDDGSMNDFVEATSLLSTRCGWASFRRTPAARRSW